MHDVIVIGGGPAGASAAIYLQRSKLDVLLVMKDYGTLEKTNHIDNYWGFEQTIGGKEMVKKGLHQAKRLGVKIIKEEVLDIDRDISGAHKFTIKTDQGQYEAKTVLLATGQSKPNLRVKGFKEYTGKGISFCAICDGFIYKNKTIGIVGNQKFMSEELETLSHFSDDIKVFTDKRTLTVDVDKEVVDEKITEIQGDEKVRRVITENGSYDVDALFVAIGTPSANDFALRMGAITDKNRIVVNEKYMTNVPGLFAAGDCIGGLLQIAKAVSDGAHAALALNKYVRTI